MNTNSNHLVSIVIPVFNGMPYLPKSLTSALAQDYEPLEILVIDNLSTDGTTEYLRTVDDPRVRVVHRHTFQPAADNWTQAVNEAAGTFIKLMCADDVLASHAISKQVRDLTDNPSAGMAASRRSVLNGAGEVLKQRHGLNGLHGFVTGETGIRACLHAGTNLLGEPVCVMFRADSIRAAMPWEHRWPYLTDVATYAKVLVNSGVVCEPDVLASFRISTTSWSSSLLAEQPRQFEAWRNHLVSSGVIPWNWMDQFRSNINLRIRTFARRMYFLRERHVSRNIRRDATA